MKTNTKEMSSPNDKPFVQSGSLEENVQAIQIAPWEFQFDSFGVINTAVPVGEQPKCTDFLGDNPAKRYDIDLEMII